MESSTLRKIVIGTWPFSGELGKVSLKKSIETIEKSINSNFLHFDTAPNYGNGFCESLIGMITDGDPKIKINTKFGNSAYNGKSFKSINLEESFSQSLIRLRTTKVDTLFLHNPRDDVEDFSKIFQLFEKLKNKKVIRKSGLSMAKGYQYGIELKRFDSIQNDFNLLYQPKINLDYSSKNKQVFFARSVLATGILSGKLSINSKFGSDDYMSSWLKGLRLKSILKELKKLKKFLIFLCQVWLEDM